MWRQCHISLGFGHNALDVTFGVRTWLRGGGYGRAAHGKVRLGKSVAVRSAHRSESAAEAPGSARSAGGSTRAASAFAVSQTFRNAHGRVGQSRAAENLEARPRLSVRARQRRGRPIQRRNARLTPLPKSCTCHGGSSMGGMVRFYPGRARGSTCHRRHVPDAQSRCPRCSKKEPLARSA